MSDPARESLNRMEGHINEMDRFLRETEPEPIQGSGGSDANFDRPTQTPTSNIDKAKKAYELYQKARNDRVIGPFVKKGEHILKERVEKTVATGLANIFHKRNRSNDLTQPPPTYTETPLLKKTIKAIPSVMAIPSAVEGAALGAGAGQSGIVAGAIGGYEAGKRTYGRSARQTAQSITTKYYDALNKPAKTYYEKKQKEAEEQIKSKQGVMPTKVDLSQPALHGGKIGKIPTVVNGSSVVTPPPVTPSVSTPSAVPKRLSFDTPKTTTRYSATEIGPSIVSSTAPRTRSNVQGSDYYTPTFAGASGYSGATPYYSYGFARKTRKTRVRRQRPTKGARKSKKRLPN